MWAKSSKGWGLMQGRTARQRLGQRRDDAFHLKHLHARRPLENETKAAEGWGVGRTTSMGARVLVAKQQHLQRGARLKLGKIIKEYGGGGGNTVQRRCRRDASGSRVAGRWAGISWRVCAVTRRATSASTRRCARGGDHGETQALPHENTNEFFTLSR